MKMKQSVLVRHVFVMLLAAMLIVAVLTGVIFSIFSGVTFTRLTRQELLPKANALAGLLARYESGEISAEVLTAMVNDASSGESVLGAYAYAVDAEGNTILTSSLFESAGKNGISQLASTALQGNTVSASVKIGSTQMYCVAVPVGTSQGAVVLCMTMVEQLAARDLFIYALLLSLVIAIPLAFLVTVKVAGRLFAPLQQIRKSARQMAEGNFTVRADESAPGEMGDVAKSLNTMATEFSGHISNAVIERDRLGYILEGLSEGIVSLDENGSVLMHNTALEKMFPESDPMDIDPKLRLIPDESVWADFDEAVKTRRTIARNLEVDGDRTLHIVITPLVVSEEVCTGVIGMVSDITQMERLEQTRRDYVANVSHEMRTPLTAMRALIEPLKEGMVKTEEDRQRYYDIIMREVMRLSRLISDLMELSRLQSGTVAIRKTSFDIAELTLDVCDRYLSIAQEHNQTFVMESDFAGCPEVYSNPDRVEQLLVILLDNAIKYTPEGGTITVGADWNADKVTLHVRDTGVGIAKKDIPYVFDRFYKVDRAHSGKGSGLGLSIAKELLHWMGEDIRVNSKEGKGSTFSFTVSVKKPGDKDEE